MVGLQKKTQNREKKEEEKKREISEEAGSIAGGSFSSSGTFRAETGEQAEENRKIRST